jgi:hypothetical protein
MDFDYKVVFSDRRTISIIVSPDKGVTVRAPHRTSLKKIDEFVNDKSGWIRKHLDNHSEIIRMNHGRKYTDGSTIPYMGKERPLKLIPGNRYYVKFDEESFEIGTKDSSDIKLIKKMMDIWYRERGQHVLALKLDIILSRFCEQNFRPSGLKVKPMKSRWGSCSTKGQITLNSELLKLEEKYIEYVIIHELCHLKHHNHGKGFYDILGKLSPDYRDIRKEMKKYMTR